MAIETNNEDIFMININPNTKTVDELLDEGKSFREINEIMKPIYEPAYIPNQYEYDFDTMVELQRAEFERLQSIKSKLKLGKV